MPSLAITDLRCEYHRNPIGLDRIHPRLSWKNLSDRRGSRQESYKIEVASSSADLLSGGADLWQTGWVDSVESTHISYDGLPLSSGQRVWWHVKIKDEMAVESEWSEISWWETGLLNRPDWKARWIAAPMAGGPRTAIPCPLLRREFTLKKNPVLSARLYTTALGLYEISLNGKTVGDAALSPGWTEYHKRVEYQTYDVTELLWEGKNALCAVMGDGWFCGHIEWRDRQFYGDRPRFLAQLHIRFQDGSETIIATDKEWRAAFGPFLEADLLMGEAYDARLEKDGWDMPDYNDSDWQSVLLMPDWPASLEASRGVPVRRQEEIRPISPPSKVNPWPAPRWIFDMGQNMVGRVKLRVQGPAGTHIQLKHAEMLTPDGNLYTENLRTARQTDQYTLKGAGEEVWEPRFTFHGFRYVEIMGHIAPPTQETVTGVVLHSDTPPTGSFSCSDPLVNQLQHNIVWGQKGNFVDIPTDCPQRDERLGWMGDAQVFCRTAAFNMDVASFFTRWLQTVKDAQTEKGEYPPIAPNTKAVGTDGGPAWSDAGIICPWTIYLCYGDTEILKEHYASMKRFMLWLAETSPDGIRCHPERTGWHCFGDWLSINAETPNDLIGTAFYAYVAGLMSKIAAVLGQEDDSRHYLELNGKVKQAFHNRFVTQAGLIDGQSQTACVLALHFDLLQEEIRPAAAASLVRDIRKRGMHLSTGFVGASYLPHVLSRFGYLDIAYALLMQRTWPSWLYPVTKGATTIWERWDGWTDEKGFQDPGMNSFNHYAYGAIGSWLYQTAAGIEIDAENPAYRHILLQPKPGGGLSHAEAQVESVYGTVKSAWRIEGSKMFWDVDIPVGCSASAILPGKDISQLSENGIVIHHVEGTSQVDQKGDYILFSLTSGKYQFLLNPVE